MAEVEVLAADEVAAKAINVEAKHRKETNEMNSPNGNARLASARIHILQSAAAAIDHRWLASNTQTRAQYHKGGFLSPDFFALTDRLRRSGAVFACFAMASNSSDELREKLRASQERLDREAQARDEQHASDSKTSRQDSQQQLPAATPPAQLQTQRKHQLKFATRSPTEAPAVDVQKIPPHSDESEQVVIALMLQHPNECVPAARRELSREHFFNPINRELFELVISLVDDGKTDALGMIAFTQVLRDRKRLDALGGPSYVVNLCTTNVPESALSWYAQTLREKHALRELISLGSKLESASYSAADDAVGDILDDFSSWMERVKEGSIGLYGVDGAMHDDAAAVLKSEIVLPPDVICGVLPRCGRCSIGGASKSYKTWILLDLAASVTTETLWLGKLPTKKGRVLYVNFELQRPYFNKRIQALCDAHQIKIEPGMLTVWHLRGHIKDWPRLQRQIRQGQFDLIILDPVYKLLLLAGARTMGVRDENSAGHIALLLDELDSLSMRTGAAIAFGAHFAKGDASAKDAIDRVSGSGVWSRDPDAIINFTQLNTDDCLAVDLKLRVYPPVESFAVRWEYPSFVADITLDPTDLKQRKNKGAAEKQHTLAELVELFERPMLTREICDVATQTMSRRTFYRLWGEGKAERAFLKCKDGKWKVNLEWITKQA